MTTSSELPKGFFPVQTRVSKGRNPDLFAHLYSEAQKGESPGTVLRRLAEEALMLRNHPLTRALQVLDFKAVPQPAFVNPSPSVIEQTKVPFNNKGDTLITGTQQKQPQSSPSRAPANGAQQMAAALVARVPATQQNRG